MNTRSEYNGKSSKNETIKGDAIHTQRDTHNQTSFYQKIQLFRFIKIMLSSMKENEYKIVADTVDNDDYVFFVWNLFIF